MAGSSKSTFIIAGCCFVAAGVLGFLAAPVVGDDGSLPPAGPVVAASSLGVSPRTVRIASLNVTASVDPVAVSADGGGLTIPASPDRVGWWVGGAALGSGRGTVLLAGHVDDADAGPGALHDLEKLPMGSMVEVDSADRRYAYKVVARRVYDKQALPDSLFTRDGRPTLALVTCGGRFHPGQGYERNVVVYAELTGPPRPLR